MDILVLFASMVRDLDGCRTVRFSNDFDLLGRCLVCTVQISKGDGLHYYSPVRRTETLCQADRELA